MRPLNDILEKIREQQESGSRRELTRTLREVMENRHTYFHQSLTPDNEGGYADALFKILFLEIEEEEESGIEIAELAYLSICHALRENHSPELLKKRILLLHYFCEYFTDAIIDIFLQNYRQDNILQARTLAIESIEKMQLSDVIYLEEHFKSFLDNDEQLTDACNDLEITVDWSEDLRKETHTLHRVMEAYLQIKHKKKE